MTAPRTPAEMREAAAALCVEQADAQGLRALRVAADRIRAIPLPECPACAGSDDGGILCPRHAREAIGLPAPEAPSPEPNPSDHRPAELHFTSDGALWDRGFVAGVRAERARAAAREQEMAAEVEPHPRRSEGGGEGLEGTSRSAAQGARRS